MADGSITKLLGAVKKGEPGAKDALFDRVYDELRQMGKAQVNHERDRNQGEATGLVHEAYARLSDEEFENRRHLFFAYARAMKQILIERARPNHLQVTPLGEAVAADTKRSRLTLDAVDIAAMLDRLARVSQREHEVVLLRFFAGLKVRIIAELLDVDERTVRRSWDNARKRLLKWASVSPEI